MGGTTILVTGGFGFIGSNVVQALSLAGYRIVIADWLGDQNKWRNVEDSLVYDIVVPENLTDWLAQYGSGLAAIIHMGAISATTERDVDRIAYNNIRLSLDLWTWCANRGVTFIYASSAATYGDGALGFVDSEAPDHLMALRPLNPYGWSKLFVDRRIVDDVRSGCAQPPQWAGLRFFNVYGPREDHKDDMRSVVNKIFPEVSAGREIMLFRSHRDDYEDGGQLRDFVYVKDCVKVICWLLEKRDVKGIFNVGSGHARTFRDLALATGRAIGKPAQIVYRDMPEAIRGRYQYFTEADVSKLRSFGYDHAFTSLEDGVSDYVKNHLMIRQAI